MAHGDNKPLSAAQVIQVQQMIDVALGKIAPPVAAPPAAEPEAKSKAHPKHTR